MVKLEKYFGLDFKNKLLLEKALTHSSYANENGLESNERLEYIGDAVLDLVVGEFLYKEYPTEDEGFLTKKRAQTVCESALVQYAESCKLGDSLLLGNGEIKTGGREKPAILADAFEAFIGAVFLDKGLEEVSKIVKKSVFPSILNHIKNDFIDYKSKIQELVQSDKRSLSYRIINETGLSHNKIFFSNVYMDNILMGEGQGKSKKEAEQNAAKQALSKLA